jgi:hypothetical protein
MVRCILRHKSTSCSSFQLSLILGFFYPISSFLSSSFIAVTVCKVRILTPGSPCIYSNLAYHLTLFHLDRILLTPCSTSLFWKLILCLLVNQLPAFYGNRRFVTAFTRTRHLPLPEPDQSNPRSHATPRRSILILSSHLSLGKQNTFKVVSLTKVSPPKP